MSCHWMQSNTHVQRTGRSKTLFRGPFFSGHNKRTSIPILTHRRVSRHSKGTHGCPSFSTTSVLYCTTRSRMESEEEEILRSKLESSSPLRSKIFPSITLITALSTELPLPIPRVFTLNESTASWNLSTMYCIPQASRPTITQRAWHACHSRGQRNSHSRVNLQVPNSCRNLVLSLKCFTAQSTLGRPTLPITNPIPDAQTCIITPRSGCYQRHDKPEAHTASASSSPGFCQSKRYTCNPRVGNRAQHPCFLVENANTIYSDKNRQLSQEL